MDKIENARAEIAKKLESDDDAKIWIHKDTFAEKGKKSIKKKELVKHAKFLL